MSPPPPTSFEALAHALAADVDDALLARSLALTPLQRLEKLMEMQGFADAARKARGRAADATP